MDLSEVIDFKGILESFDQNGELPAGVFTLQANIDRPVFGLESRPGMQNILKFMVCVFSILFLSLKIYDCLIDFLKLSSDE